MRNKEQETGMRVKLVMQTKINDVEKNDAMGWLCLNSEGSSFQVAELLYEKK